MLPQLGELAPRNILRPGNAPNHGCARSASALARPATSLLLDELALFRQRSAQLATAACRAG